MGAGERRWLQPLGLCHLGGRVVMGSGWEGQQPGRERAGRQGRLGGATGVEKAQQGWERWGWERRWVLWVRRPGLSWAQGWPGGEAEGRRPAGLLLAGACCGLAWGKVLRSLGEGFGRTGDREQWAERRLAWWHGAREVGWAAWVLGLAVQGRAPGWAAWVGGLAVQGSPVALAAESLALAGWGERWQPVGCLAGAWGW